MRLLPWLILLITTFPTSGMSTNADKEEGQNKNAFTTIETKKTIAIKQQVVVVKWKKSAIDDRNLGKNSSNRAQLSLDIPLHLLSRLLERARNQERRAREKMQATANRAQLNGIGK